MHMDKTIEKHLRKRGVFKTMPSAEDLPFSERAPRFFEWFHQSVLGFDTEEYRRQFWREVYKKGHVIGHVPHSLSDYLKRRSFSYRQDMADILAYSLMLGGSFVIWVMRRQIEKHLRRLKRPGYYETELARRKLLAAERRRIRKRRTLNQRPTAEALREAFYNAKKSPAAMLRFGSMLEDVECYVDNSAIFDEAGNVAGRRGGIRQYLRDELPELSQRYKTVMRYKAIAKRFRQAFGVSDPIPASAILPTERAEDVSAKNSNENGTTPQRRSGSFQEFASVEILEEIAKKVVKMLEGCENSFLSLAAALEMRVGPDYTPKLECQNKLLPENAVECTA